MRKWMDLFLKKNHLLRCWGWPSLLNWIGVLTLSLLLKLPPRKLELCSMKFLSPEVALYLYKSTIKPCMEYCCHVWAGAPSCYFQLLDKLQKQIGRTVGPSLFYRYYFGRCSSQMAQLVPLPFSRRRSTCYSDGLHDFSVTIPRCYKDVYVNSFFSSHSLTLEFFIYRMLSLDLWS